MKPMCTINLLGFTLVLGAFVVCCAAPNLGAVQSSQRPEPIMVDGNNNETVKAELDLLGEKAGKDKLIILITRLGKGEYSKRLNQRRLRTIGEYLRLTRAISAQRLVTAEGDRVRDVGRIEAYLDGNLFMVFQLDRNKNFAREP